MKSDNKIFYDISIYYLSEKLYIKGISKDKFNKKQYSNEYTLEQIKLNKFFYLHENISEIYDEFNSIIQKSKNNNEIILLEETNKLILRIPLPSIKIKEFLFEINEIAMSMEQKLEDVFIQLNDIQKINAQRYESIKNENKDLNQLNINIKQLVIELKEQNNKLNEQNVELKEQNNEIKNQINELKSQNNELKIQNNELKNQIEKIININTSIDEQIKIMNVKNNETNTKFISELNNYNQILSQKLNEKIDFIYKFIESQKNKEIIEINKKNEEKQNDFYLIKNWINESLDTKQNIEFQLIYKKSRDGSSISDFHYKCDNKGKTVMIITTNQGLKFGGFKNDSWNKDGWKKNVNDFVFSLTLRRKFKHCKEGDSTLGNNDYICFGNSSDGGDISFCKSMNVGRNGNCSFKTDIWLNMKNNWFQAKEIEVYKTIY